MGVQRVRCGSRPRSERCTEHCPSRVRDAWSEGTGKLRPLGRGGITELSHKSNNEIAFIVGATILKAAPDLAQELVEKYATVVDKKRLETRGFAHALEDAHQRRLKFQPEAILTERIQFRNGAVDTQVA